MCTDIIISEQYSYQMSVDHQVWESTVSSISGSPYYKPVCQDSVQASFSFHDEQHPEEYHLYNTVMVHIV